MIRRLAIAFGLLAAAAAWTTPARAILVEVSWDVSFTSSVTTDTFVGVIGVFDTNAPGPFDLNGVTLDGVLTFGPSASDPLPLDIPMTTGPYAPHPSAELAFEFTNVNPGSLAGRIIDLNPGDGEVDLIGYFNPNYNTYVLFEEGSIVVLSSRACGFGCEVAESFSFSIVPEPATATLLGAALLGLAVHRRNAPRGRPSGGSCGGAS